MLLNLNYEIIFFQIVKGRLRGSTDRNFKLLNLSDLIHSIN